MASALGIRILGWETGLLEFDHWASKMLEGEEENAKKHGRKMLGIKKLTWKKERSYKDRKNYIWKKGREEVGRIDVIAVA